jgi:hypothetical protein
MNLMFDFPGDIPILKIQNKLAEIPKHCGHLAGYFIFRILIVNSLHFMQKKISPPSHQGPMGEGRSLRLEEGRQIFVHLPSSISPLSVSVPLWQSFPACPG